MKSTHKRELIFSINGITCGIQDISTWTVQDIIGLIKIQNKFYPEKDYRIKRNSIRVDQQNNCGFCGRDAEANHSGCLQILTTSH